MRGAQRKRRLEFLFISLIFLSILLTDCIPQAFLPLLLRKFIGLPPGCNIRVKYVSLSPFGITFNGLSLRKGDRDLLKGLSVSIIPTKGLSRTYFREGRIDLLSLLNILSPSATPKAQSPRVVSLRDVLLNFKGAQLRIESGYFIRELNYSYYNLSLRRGGSKLLVSGFANPLYVLMLISLPSRGFLMPCVYDLRGGAFEVKLINEGAKLGEFYLSNVQRIEGQMKAEWELYAGEIRGFGSLVIKRQRENFNGYFKVKRLEFGDFKVITNFYFNSDQREGKLRLFSFGSVLNNKPFPEFKLSLSLLEDGISIDELKFDGGIKAWAHLGSRGNLKLNVEFNDFPPHEVLKILYPLYGRYLELKGMRGKLSYLSYNGEGLLDFYLETPAGRLGDICFQWAKIHLLGKGGTAEFLDSQLLIDGKLWALKGKLELSEFPHPEMFRQVKLVPLSPHAFWESYSYEEIFGSRKLSLVTKLKRNVKLDYNVEFLEDENYNKGEITLEIEGRPSLKLRLRDEEEIMGLEKSFKF